MTLENEIRDYRLKGDSITIGNLAYNEVVKEVLSLHNEEFRGLSHIEDNYGYRLGEQISRLNVPKALNINTIIRERFPQLKMQVLSFSETLKYWSLISKEDIKYLSDTNSLVIYPNQERNEELRKVVLDILEIKHVEIPLIVSGLGVKRADNNYGFTFIETDYTERLEASFLSRDEKLIYSEGEVVISNEGINVWTALGQSGLRKVSFGLFGIYTWNIFLSDTDDNTLIKVLQK